MTKHMKESRRIVFLIVGAIALIVLAIFGIAGAIGGYIFHPAVEQFFKASIMEMKRFELYALVICAVLVLSD